MEQIKGNAKPDAPAAVFAVDGEEFGLAEMLSTNADDAELCAWLNTAGIGDSFAAILDCRRVA